MPKYDSALFEPPAPVARIALRNPQKNVFLADVPMLIDTGADVSLVPRTYVEQLEAWIDTEQVYELMSFDGEVSQTVAAKIDVVFLNRTFKGLYLLTEEEIGVLGRDILNFVAVLLDGPQLTWTEYRPVTAKKGGSRLTQ
jgi:hypothetical protein